MKAISVERSRNIRRLRYLVLECGHPKGILVERPEDMRQGRQHECRRCAQAKAHPTRQKRKQRA